MPLGVFDSGVGGLTVFREIVERFPAADLIYLGDIARLPYGTKSPEMIIKCAVECAQYLSSFKVDALVVACNSISSYALPVLRDSFGIPVLGVIEAGAKSALELTENGNIGVIGTRATISSGSYQKMLDHLKNRPLQVHAMACPLFVPLAEEYLITGAIPELIIRHYLDELVATGIDTLILGCTHYPLLAPLIGTLYPGIKLADSAKGIAKELAALGLDLNEGGKRDIYVTDMTPAIARLQDVLLQETRPAKKISL